MNGELKMLYMKTAMAAFDGASQNLPGEPRENNGNLDAEISILAEIRNGDPRRISLELESHCLVARLH